MSDLQSILPSNSTHVERAFEVAFKATAPDLSVISTLIDPLTCPASVLGWLAWAFSVDDWDAAWSEDAKRNSIAASISVHQRKGTLGAVQDALAAAGFGDADVIERFGWEFHNATYSYDGAISHSEGDHWAEYRVQLTRPITVEQATQVRRILASVAPVRSHLKALDFTEALNIYDARITHDGQFTHGVA